MRKLHRPVLHRSTVPYLALFLVLAALAGLELFTLVAYMMRPFLFTLNGLSGFYISLDNFEFAQLTYIMYLRLCPFFLYSLLTAWVIAAVGMAMARRQRHAEKPSSDAAMSIHLPQPSLTLTYCGLTVALILSAYVALYPNLSTGKLGGADALWYYENLLHIQSISQAFASFRTEPRSLYFVILVLIRDSFRVSSLDAIRIGTVILAVAYTFAVFLVSRELTHNTIIGVVGAFFAAGSPNVTVGVWAGIYSNWLALVLFTLFFWLVLRCLGENGNRMRFALLAAVVNIAILLIHPWTWAVALASALVLLLTAYVAPLDRKAKRLVFWATFPPAVVVILSIVLFAFAGGGSYSLANLQVLNAATTQPGLLDFQLSRLTYFPSLLFVTLITFVGGSFQNTILLVLSGLLPFIRKFANTRAGWILASWLMPTSLLILFSSTDLQWRLFYLLPFPVVASIVAGWIIADLAKLRGGYLRRSLTLLFVLFLILGVLSFAFASLGSARVTVI